MKLSRTIKYYSLLIILIISTVLSTYCFAAVDVDMQAMYLYANNHLNEALEDIPEGDETKYGFNVRDEFRSASLGIPYQEYDMDREQPTGYWRIPVKVDGDNRVLLRLRNTEEGWKISGVSGSELATNLGDLENYVAAQGQTPRVGIIIRDYTMRCDYVQFDLHHDYVLSGYIYPLWSASRFMAESENTSSTGAMDYQSYDVNIIKELRKSSQNRIDYINSINNVYRGQ
jgi:hypothetical protein